MRAVLALAIIALVACRASPGVSPQGAASEPVEVTVVPEPTDAQADAGAPRGPAVAELRCLREPLPDRIRVQFDRGHSARDLAVWYATTTCRRVTAPRPLLARSTLTQIDALASRDELLELFDSLLRGVGLHAVEHGDEVEVVTLAPDADGGAGAELVVLWPVSDEEDKLP
jgi:hypothetical protein